MISTSASVMVSRSSRVNDGARAAVEQGAEVEKGPRDMDRGDLDVPVFIRGERLHKAGAFQ
jgi:hypothetical protein